jgi:hypothetical protein
MGCLKAHKGLNNFATHRSNERYRVEVILITQENQQQVTIDLLTPPLSDGPHLPKQKHIGPKCWSLFSSFHRIWHSHLCPSPQWRVHLNVWLHTRCDKA